MRTIVSPAPRALWSSLFVLGIAIALVVVQAVRAMHGHAIEWFSWSLLFTLIGVSLMRFPLSQGWNRTLRMLILLGSGATAVGMALAIVRDALARRGA